MELVSLVDSSLNWHIFHALNPDNAGRFTSFMTPASASAQSAQAEAPKQERALAHPYEALLGGSLAQIQQSVGKQAAAVADHNSIALTAGAPNAARNAPLARLA